MAWSGGPSTSRASSGRSGARTTRSRRCGVDLSPLSRSRRAGVPEGRDPERGGGGWVGGRVHAVVFRRYVSSRPGEGGLKGYVLNVPDALFLGGGADPDAAERLRARLAGEAPPLARVERVS